MRIRILHIIDHLGYGGAPIVVKNIAERIDKERFDVRVCALRTNPEAVPIQAPTISLTHGKYSPLALRAIRKVCNRDHIDILHCHLQKSIATGLFVGHSCEARVLLHEHGPIFRGGSGCLYRGLLRLMGKRADGFIANSTAAATRLSQVADIPAESVLTIQNFVDFGRFDPDRHNRQDARKRLNIREGDTVIGFAGRLDHCKGVDLLLHAIKILTDTGKHCHLAIIGDGPEKKSLEGLCRDLGVDSHVSFLGLCEDPAEFMPAFDIGVVPSRREAFGIVAVEFMRMRVPVIASAVGGLPELIDDHKTGLLLSDTTGQGIADAVEELVANRELAESLVRNAEASCQEFDGRKQMQQIAEIYEKLGTA